MTIIRFDTALSAARDAIADILQSHAEATPPIIVRGVTGRLRLYLRSANTKPFDDAWAAALRPRLGAFAEDADDFVLQSDDFYDPSVIEDASDLQNIADNGAAIFLLDRPPHGEDWLRPLPPAERVTPPRAVLFGIKGGVGRSTALAVWAWWLAQRGERVLVVDLDLESPGLGPTLLPENQIPRFGLIDGLVEDIVDHCDDDLIHAMMVESPLSRDLAGEIWVVPAAGCDPGWYTAKLLRASLDLPQRSTGEDGSFAGRLERLIGRLEAAVQPSIVLLDSRAGLHDMAAIALTRLGATGFLFAANTEQTWKAYEILFTTWKRHQQIRALRTRLQMVAATIPPNDRDTYLASYREQSWKLWEPLYDEVGGDDDLDLFNFNRDAQDAPHWPLMIEWEERLRHFNPVLRPEALNPAYIEAAFGDFLNRATDLVLPKAAAEGAAR